MGQLIMGVDYSNLNPQTDLSLEVWSGADVNLVSDIFSDLQAKTPVEYRMIDSSTITLRAQLNNPTYGQPAFEFIVAIYDMNPDPVGQAHVLGNLLAPDTIDLVAYLLGLPDNPLATRLGDERSTLLLDIAEMIEKTSRDRALLNLSKIQNEEMLTPSKFEDPTLLEDEDQHDDDNDSNNEKIIKDLVNAVTSNDLSLCKNIIEEISDGYLDSLGHELGMRLGNKAVPVINQLMDNSDKRISDFAFYVSKGIGMTNLVEAGSSGRLDDEQKGEQKKIIDTSELEQMIMSPSFTPATLAIQFVGIQNSSACLLELVVR